MTLVGKALSEDPNLRPNVMEFRNILNYSLAMEDPHSSCKQLARKFLAKEFSNKETINIQNENIHQSTDSITDWRDLSGDW